MTFSCASPRPTTRRTPQFVGNILYDTLVYSQRGAFKPKMFFAALGIDPPASPEALDGIGLMVQGRACAVRVGHQERDTGTVAVIEKYLPLGSKK